MKTKNNGLFFITVHAKRSTLSFERWCDICKILKFYFSLYQKNSIRAVIDYLLAVEEQLMQQLFQDDKISLSFIILCELPIKNLRCFRN